VLVSERLSFARAPVFRDESTAVIEAVLVSNRIAALPVIQRGASSTSSRPVLAVHELENHVANVG
jgi:hypothetical protein